MKIQLYLFSRYSLGGELLPLGDLSLLEEYLGLRTREGEGVLDNERRALEITLLLAFEFGLISREPPLLERSRSRLNRTTIQHYIELGQFRAFKGVGP